MSDKLLPPQTDPLMALVERATFDPTFDPGKLQVLMEMKFKWDAEQARLKFEAALEKFKANKPVIERTKKVVIATRDGKEMGYSHPELDKVCDIVTEALLQVGITHYWKTGAGEAGRVRVTCYLKGFGHTEEAATLEGPPDTSGSKNNVQAIGSTVFYLERYTLLGGLGLAPKNAINDNDGKTEGMEESAIADYCIQMQDAMSFAELKPVFGECWQKAVKCNDKEAQNRFRTVYEQRKKDLNVGKEAK